MSIASRLFSWRRKPPVRPEAPRGEIFVGRKPEIGVFFERLASDRPTIITVTGDYGMGKTTLLQEFAARAPREGALAASVGESDEGVPGTLRRLAEKLANGRVNLESFTETHQTYARRLAQLKDQDPPKAVLELLSKGISGTVGLATGAFAAALSGGALAPVGAAVGGVSADLAGSAAVDAWRYLAGQIHERHVLDLVLDPVSVLTRSFLDDVATQKRQFALCVDVAETRFSEISAWLGKLASGEYRAMPNNLTLVVATRREQDPALFLDAQLFVNMPLGPLDETDAREYLVKSGVTDAAVIAEIFRRSGRSPFELALIANEKPKRVADVTDLSRAVVSGSLRYIADPARRQLAQSACLLRIVNRDALAVVLDKKDVTEEFAWLSEQPFIKMRDTGRAYRDELRPQLFRQLRLEAPRSIFAVHRRLADYYGGLLSELGSDERLWREREWQEYELERVYHHLWATRSTAVAANGFMRAYSVDRKQFARQYASTVAQVGSELESEALQKLGLALVAGLHALETEKWEGVIEMLTTLLDTCALEERWRARTLDWRGFALSQAGKPVDALVDLDAALALEPTNTEYRMDRAQALFAAGREDDARAEAATVLAAEPKNVAALRFALMLEQLNGSFDEALKYVRRVLEIDPKDAQVRASEAEILQMTGHADAAIESLRDAIAVIPEEPRLRLSLAQLLFYRGQSAEAFTILDELVKKSPNDFGILSIRTVLLAQSGDLERALASADDLEAASVPAAEELGRISAINSVHIRERLARSAARLNRVDVEDVSRFLRLATEGGTSLAGPLRAEAFAARSVAYLRAGDRDKAIVALDRAIEYDPARAALWRARALPLLGKGDRAGARATLEQALALEPNDAPSLSLRARIHLEEGDVEAALKDTERVEQLIPYDYIAKSFHLTLLAMRNDYAGAGELARVLADHAEELLDQMAAAAWLTEVPAAPPTANPVTSEFSIAAMRGVIERSRSDRPSVIREFQSVPFALEALLQQQRGALEPALEAVNKAIELAPDDLGRYSLRAEILSALGHHDLAIADYSRVIAADNAAVPALIGRATAYEMTGDLENAITDTLAICELVPDTYWFRVILNALLLQRAQYAAAADNQRVLLANASAFLDQLEHAVEGADAQGGALPSAARPLIEHMRPLVELSRRDREAAIREMDAGLSSLDALAALQRGDADAELEAWTRAIELGAPNSEWLARRAEVYRVRGQLDHALADLDAAIELDAGVAWIRGTRGQVYAAMGRVEEALTELNRAVALDGRIGWIYQARGEVRYDREEFTDAASDFRLALENEVATDASCSFLLASSLFMLGENEEALQIVSDLLKRGPAVEAGLLLQARILHFADRSSESLNCLERLVESFPDSSEGQSLLCELLLLNGRDPEAVLTSERLVATNPDESWYSYLRGLALGAVGRTTEAIDFISAAIRIEEPRLTQPDVTDQTRSNAALYRLARQSSGDVDAAEMTFAELARTSRPWWLRSAMRDLKTLSTVRRDDLPARIARDIAKRLAPVGAGPGMSTQSQTKPSISDVTPPS